ncbi:MAG: protein kinase [Myxococcaceae bacterium]
MAELFLAFTAGPGGFRKFVAVKQILPDIKKDESFVKMFLDEARITAAFNHGNIGQVYDLGESDGELYLAMEFISGQNLEQVIKRATKREYLLPSEFSCRVVRDACLALHYAHHFVDGAGRPSAVVHRDVSPKNVMVTYTGDVKMIDFGIAKAKGRLNRTQVGIVKGTSGYMSPEQVRGGQLDGRTDLFAAGVMLHELLTGQRLFVAPNDAAMMMKIAQAEVTPPREINPGISEQLEAVIMKSLARKPEDRYATGKEMARAIEQASGGMAEEEMLAQIMSELFDDKIQTTRALLEMANNADDSQQVKANLTRAVEQLEEEDAADGEAESTPRGRKAPSKATPAPRPGLSTKSKPPQGASKRNLPPVADETMPPVSRSSVRSPSQRNLATNASRKDSGPKRRPSQIQEVSEQSTDRRGELREIETDPRGSAKKAPPADVAPPPEKKKGGILGTLFGAVLVLGAFGFTYGVYKGDGPFKPIHDAAMKEIQGEPPPAPPPSLEELAKSPKGNKPQFLIDKERADAAAAAEKQRQKDIEAQQNDPERQKYLAELEAQIKDLDRLEAEQQQLKADAIAGKQAGAEQKKRIDDLEKQINELKTGIAAKKKARAGSGDPNAVEVVRDRKSATAASVGYLNLRTVNPSSAAIFDGDASLGSTPLVKVPLDEGVHRLRVVDGDGKNRILSVNLKAGATVEMKAVDVSSLPFQP